MRPRYAKPMCPSHMKSNAISYDEPEGLYQVVSFPMENAVYWDMSCYTHMCEDINGIKAHTSI